MIRAGCALFKARGEKTGERWSVDVKLCSARTWHPDPKVGARVAAFNGVLGVQGRRLGSWAAAASVLLLLWGCAGGPSVGVPPAAAPTAQRPNDDPGDRLPASPQAQSAALHALGLVGTPYRYGGNTPDSGFDCSGLIGYVYAHAADLRLPRTVAALASWGWPVEAGEARTGDLVVFTIKGRVAHAGIYVGDGRFVHAPSTGGTVRLDRLDAGYWSQQEPRFRRGV